MKIKTIQTGSWLSNCHVVTARADDGSLHAAVVDPSVAAEEILRILEEENAVLDMIILTHGHFDHIMSLNSLRDATGAPAYIHQEDAEMLSDAKKNAYSFFFGSEFSQRDAERTLSDGDVLGLGGETLTVMHLPGHTKGSIALLSSRVIITGDTLFSQGFGRYDLYGGNALTLKQSLRSLRQLDRSLTVCPGHGDSTSLGAALDAISYFLN